MSLTIHTGHLVEMGKLELHEHYVDYGEGARVESFYRASDITDAPAQEYYKVEEVEAREKEIEAFLQSVPCSCAHCDPHSSQEWDRQHESWCPSPKAQRLLDRLRGGV